MHVTLSDPANLGGDLDASFIRYAGMAWQEWSVKLALPSSTAIDIIVTDAIPTAAATYAWGGDVEISINPAYYRTYADLNPAYLPGDPTTPGKDAPDYVFLHELGHALFENNNRFDDGMAMSNWAYYVSTIDGRPYFTGPHAEAVYGGPVPLTQDGYNGHLATPQDDRLKLDIMSGIAPDRSREQVISSVNLASALDCYLALNPLTELYVATFGRMPDAGGLAYWQGRLDAGMTLGEIAQSFFAQPEAQAAFAGGNLVETVYQHTLGRAPDAAGFAYWTAELESGHVREGEFVLAIINGAQGADMVHLIGVLAEA